MNHNWLAKWFFFQIGTIELVTQKDVKTVIIFTLLVKISGSKFFQVNSWLKRANSALSWTPII